MIDQEKLEQITLLMNDLRYSIEQETDSADYHYNIGDTETGEQKMMEVGEMKDELQCLEDEYDKIIAGKAVKKC